jgi:hypothetical protein
VFPQARTKLKNHRNIFLGPSSPLKNEILDKSVFRRTMMKSLALSTGVLAFVATGCSTLGTVNSFFAAKTKSVEYYRIFDIKTKADREAVAESASKGLGINTNDFKELRPIPKTAELPSKAGRFKVVDLFEGSKLAGLAAMSGSPGLKFASCEDASWIAHADKNIPGHSDLKLTACIFPYQEGYHLDLYATFQTKEGGLEEIGRQLASAALGTPEEWAEKTFLDIVRKIRTDTQAQISYLEGYPKVQGTPWLDSGEKIGSAN